MKASAWLFFLSFLFIEISFAQKKIEFQQLSDKNGLSQNSVNFIHQDSRGFMWFGTQNGLNKYDGSTITIFKNESSDSTSISNNVILSAIEDKSHNLWFGTNLGLSRYNRASNTFSNYQFDEGPKYAMRPAWCVIVSGRDSTVWIGASGGLFSLHATTKKFKRYPINDSSQLTNTVRAMCEDKNGNLWIGTDSGDVFQLDRSKQVFTLLNINLTKSKSGEDMVSSIVEDTEGFVWIGKRNGKLSRYDYTRNSFIHYHDFDGKYPITSLMLSKEGQLWVGTDKGGNFIYRKDINKFIPFGDRLKNGAGVVRSLFSDTKGDVWIGSYHGGTYLFDKSDTTFSHFAPYNEIKDDEESNSVLAIFEDTDNRVWMGTDGGGLIEEHNGKLHYYKTDSSKNSIAGNTILCIAPHGDKKLYIGTYADGISVFDKKLKKFKTYNQSNGLNDNSVWAIYPDKDFVWIGTNRGGLNILDVKKGTFQYFVNNLTHDQSISSNGIRAIFKDSKNNLWIGTVSGLNRFNEKDSTFQLMKYYESKGKLSNIVVLCIYEDKKKNLWLGTYGDGLKKYDYQTNTFTSFLEKDGLPGDFVLGILEDEQGSLWLSTNNGISKFDFESRRFRNYDTGSGLKNTQFNTGAYFKNNDGKMYFGNNEGVCSFIPTSIRQNNYTIPVVITDFLLFNKPVALGKESVLKQAITETSEIVLDYTQSVFSLKFSALSYTHADKNSFAYKLEPFDKDWNYTDKVRSATYTNLDAGTYTFRVKASNSDGVWNEEGSSLIIHVLPPWWETWWFRSFLVTVLTSVVLVIFVLRTQNIRIANRKLEENVNQKTKELQATNKALSNQELEIKKQNKTLKEQGEELAAQNEELIQSQEEIAAQRDLVAQQNQALNEKQIIIEQHNENLEGEIANRTTELVEYNQQLEQFAFISAHNLRAPVARILGLGQILDLAKNNPDEKDSIYPKLIHTAKELDSVVKDLNTILELKKNNETFVTDVALASVIEMILQNLEKEITNAHASITTDFKHVSNLHTVKPYIDSILYNLISNAIKYRHPDRSPVIHIKTERLENEVCLSVSDNGLGIDVDLFRDKLFTLYKRFHLHIEGKGMGLYLVKTQMSSLGGRIEVESEVNVGTTFRAFFKT